MIKSASFRLGLGLAALGALTPSVWPLGCASSSAGGGDDTVVDSGSGSHDATIDSGQEDTSTPSFGDSSASDGSSFSDVGTNDSSIPAVDSGAPDARDGSSVDAGPGDGGSNDGTVGSDACGSLPTLHPGDGTNLYCPFGPDANAPIQCEVGQQFCCIAGKVNNVFPPSDCEAISSGDCSFVEAGVSGSAQLQCEDPATDCPSGNICCGAPNAIATVAGCGYNKLTGFTYTRCAPATACTATEFQVCAADSECPSGQHCVPFKAKGLDLGSCQ